MKYPSTKLNQKNVNSPEPFLRACAKCFGEAEMLHYSIQAGVREPQ